MVGADCVSCTLFSSSHTEQWLNSSLWVNLKNNKFYNMMMKYRCTRLCLRRLRSSRIPGECGGFMFGLWYNVSYAVLDLCFYYLLSYIWQTGIWYSDMSKRHIKMCYRSASSLHFIILYRPISVGLYVCLSIKKNLGPPIHYVLNPPLFEMISDYINKVTIIYTLFYMTMRIHISTTKLFGPCRQTI